jgi:hypothetical protein
LVIQARLTLFSPWEYPEKMKMHSNIVKVVFAFLVFSLVVPFSPSVSSAKAKICCKKNCKSVEAAHQATTSTATKHCHQQDGSAGCDNESCLITDEKSESFSFVKTQEAKQLNLSLVASLVKETPQSFQFAPAKGAGAQKQGPPLYLSNSILRV